MGCSGVSTCNRSVRPSSCLRVDRSVRVLVIEDSGAAVAAVEVMARAGTQTTWRFGWTDGEGRLVLAHVQEWAEQPPARSRAVFVRHAGGDTEPIVVDPAAPPAELMSRLPSCGSVAVHFRDATGRPRDPRYGPLSSGEAFREASLSTWLREPASSAEPPERAVAARVDAHGDVVFGGVPFGLHVMARAAGYAAGSGWHGAVVTGPTRDNPRIDITLSEAPDTVVLTGLLVGVDGVPAAYARYRVEHGAADAGSGSTDSDGRFRVALSRLPDALLTALTFRITGKSFTDHVAIELEPRPLVRGENELGEIRLADAATLLGAKLVMSDGSEPLPFLMYVQRRLDGRWTTVNATRRWDPSGAFTFVGTVAKGTPMRLVVEAAKFLPVEPIEFAAGATGLEIPVHRGGSVVATFVVDGSIRTERLELRCRNTDPTAKPIEFVRILEARAIEEFVRKPPPDGRLRREWSGLAPGTYRVQAFCGGSPVPIAEVNGIVVTDGPCRDSRLESIDLRGKAKAFTIQVTSADGVPIADPRAAVIVRGDREGWVGYAVSNGKAEVIAGHPVDVVVVADGYETAFANGVVEARTIVLRRAARQRVRLELPRPLPDGGTLHVTLTPRIEAGDVFVQIDGWRAPRVSETAASTLAVPGFSHGGSIFQAFVNACIYDR